MSQRAWNESNSQRGFPRVSGDEPGTARAGQPPTQFSPRERG